MKKRTQHNNITIITTTNDSNNDDDTDEMFLSAQQQHGESAPAALEEQIAVGFDRRIVELETTLGKLRQLADAAHAIEDEYAKRAEQATRTLVCAAPRLTPHPHTRRTSCS